MTIAKRTIPPFSFISPEPFAPQTFTDPKEAVEALTALYERNTAFLINSFTELAKGAPITGRYRACYPQVSLETSTFGHVDSRLSYGHVTSPGVYTTTITRPELFRHYLKEQSGASDQESRRSGDGCRIGHAHSAAFRLR